MHTLRHICMGLLSASLLFAAACGDDGNVTVDAAVIDAPDAAGGCVCDPVGAFPEQSELLNATVKSDVEVLTRTPRHPGCPGPSDLP